MTKTNTPAALATIPGPLHTLDQEQLAEVRTALLAEGDEIVAGAEGDNLSGAEAERFASIETIVRRIDHWRDVAQRATELGPNLTPARPDTGTSRDPDARIPGGIPRLALGTDQVRELHTSYLQGSTATAEVRAITDAPRPVDTLVATPFDARREPTRVAALLATQAVTTPQVTYYAQTGVADQAATVAEGAEKPESTPGWEPVTVPIRKLAHFTEVSTEALDDFASFASIIEAEMRTGLINLENDQVLNGNGSGTNIRGMLQTSGILSVAPAGPEAHYRTLRRAIRLLRAGTSFTQPDAIVMHPADAEIFDLTNSDDEGLRAVTSISEAGTTTAWGATIVVTTQIAEGTALVGNMAEAAVVFQRQAPRVMLDPYSRSDRNLVRVIVEERIGLGVVRPSALCAVTFAGAAS